MRASYCLGAVTALSALSAALAHTPAWCTISRDVRIGSTADFQRHIDRCRGETPRGDHATLLLTRDATATVGSVTLPSNFTLRVDGSLTASTERSEFPLIPPLPTYGTARDNARNVSLVHRALLYSNGTKNVRLTGTGSIDGQGGVGGWWAQEKNHTLLFQRPRLVQFVHASNVTIDGGLILLNSPFWTVHLVYSEDVLVSEVHIRAPRDSPNTDGVDVDSTQRVNILRCVIDVGDDAVAIKSGLNQWGRAVNLSSANVLIEHNRIWGKAIAVGSEMSGGVFNVTVRHNVMGDSAGAVTGLLIKSARGRGGSVRNITFADNHLLNVSRVYSWIPALVVTDHYGGGKAGNATTTPVLEDIRFINITVDFAEQAGCLAGLPERHLVGIAMENVTFRRYRTGWACQDCDGCEAVCNKAASNTSCAF